MGERTVDDYIAALDEPRQSVARRLREVVRAAAPEAHESIKWAQPVYESDGPFVALKAFPKHVTLTFWRGATLADRADADGLLEGDGDRMRHARFRTVDDVRDDPIGTLVRRAVELNAELGDPTKR